jgi:Protein of unknown function (DUF4238)
MDARLGAGELGKGPGAMPQNKSHHFVPQFLLRLFSVDGSSIGLYNLRSGRIVTEAAVKHQAC